MIAARVFDSFSVLLMGVILGCHSSMMGRAFPTAFPIVEQWTCQHDRCHDDGNDFLGHHDKHALRFELDAGQVMDDRDYFATPESKCNSTLSCTIGNFSLL